MKSTTIKRLLVSLLVISLLFASFSFAVSAIGTEPMTDSEGVYLIESEDNLLWFAERVNSGYTGINGKLTYDIILNRGYSFNADGSYTGGSSPYTWSPIGSASSHYTGTFDGNNKTVSGMYINGDQDYIGLFGCIGSNGTVKNVTVANSYISGNVEVGGVCGWNGYGTITNCHNSGTVKGKDNVGGVCGFNGNGRIIEYSYNTGTVTGNTNVGGVCGSSNANSTIENCYNTGAITGTTDVGGICGFIYSGTIKGGYVAGTINGYPYFIGVCGNSNGVSIIDCYYLTYSETIDGGYAAEQFADGTVTWLLNDEKSTGSEENPLIWYQKLGTDDFPTFDSTRGIVYECNSFDENGFKSDKTQYANVDDLGEYQPAKKTTDKHDLDNNGTNDEVYEIANAGQLSWFAEHVNSGNTGINGLLMNDININPGYTFGSDGSYTGGSSPYTWSPIGSASSHYTGTFDGNNKTVSGMYINGDQDYIGLFGCIGSNGTVKNVTVANSYISGNVEVGGVCGWNGYGTITNCHNSGTVKGKDNVGGVCGFNGNGRIIEYSYNTGTVTGNTNVSGVCGYNNTSGSIDNCYNTGTIIGSSVFGGVCGYNKSSGSIEYCYNTGTITGGSVAGGVCGYSYASTTKNCYNTGAVIGSLEVGGVSGIDNYGTIENCYNTGILNNTQYVFSIYGSSYESLINNCYYLTDSETSNGGRTEEQFADGSVTWLLNGQSSVGTQEAPLIWYQNIDNGETHDLTPRFTGGKVYNINDDYTNLLNCITGVLEVTSIENSAKLIFTDITGANDLANIAAPIDGFTVEVTPSRTGAGTSYCGTGSKITVSANGKAVENYTLIVNGDVTGDSFCDALDCMRAELVRSGNYTPSTAEQNYYDVDRNGVYEDGDFQNIMEYAVGIR